MAFESVNPATGERLASYEPATESQLRSTLDRVAEGVYQVAATPPDERAARLRRLAGVLGRDRSDLSLLATREMGKPITQSRAEVDRCVQALHFLADHGPGWLVPEQRPCGLGEATVRFDPLGGVLGVMPWNFPYWQLVRFAAGALLAGNVVLIKPAPSTVGCALALHRAFREAGFEAGTYETLLAEVRDLPVVVGHPAVAAVSLTGSVRAGRSLAALAGSCGKPAVLELGGSDAFVVLDDADVPAAARAAAAARCLNSGQSCIAAKRFIATDGIYPAFRDAFMAEMDRLRVGDPLDERTDIGPLARFDLRDQVLELVRRSTHNSTVIYPTRPKPLPDRGAYVHPMILEVTQSELPAAWHCEVFGPVAVLRWARDTAEAFELAAGSDFGLGCSVWTRSPRAHADAAARLPVGNVFFNGMVRSTAELPFGGVKDSGFGRELGREGVRQFTNVKTVVIVPT